ncbi:nuclear protein SNF4 [Nadsonia fulvescens var. elongata DSM 6958]|uniref:5'-AMP-activated protein kinase subunit gamma n=1 Tax=Nadsonia fulvescens var. elongata DSM 6958 TaxID=857566 RepID=A0A1E3PT48_9ASCO|nr:nuclear protein SNF4 [Nadsonia fulvescens var. elongata DSM 6958]
MNSTTDNQIIQDQKEAVKAIREFLKSKTSYDVLPVSFRLIVLDISLLVKKSLTILLQNNIVSAPLWNSKTSKFAGLLTASDYINVIQYYFQHQEKMDAVEHFSLEGLREIEKSIGADPIENKAIHPMKPLFDACVDMIDSKARRIPLIDTDEQSGREIIVSVLTQYRILKFVALNCKETRNLLKPLKDLETSFGRYDNLASANMNTPVIEVIHMLAKFGISSVPIVDEQTKKLINVYEAVDVLALIKGGIYTDLNLTVGEALMKRSDDFEGVHTCTFNDRLDTIMDTIRRSRLHRLFIVDEEERLLGVVTLSDILKYLLFGECDE